MEKREETGDLFTSGALILAGTECHRQAPFRQCWPHQLRPQKRQFCYKASSAFREQHFSSDYIHVAGISHRLVLVGGHPHHNHINTPTVPKVCSLYLALAFKDSTGSSACRKSFKVSDATPKEGCTVSPAPWEISLGKELLQKSYCMVRDRRMSQDYW